ncbi:unnamed protein product [Protopolystoma xenopodis]|uniref:Uncharacterized protein n=1 Tax=Protopolystoma xenopodis TaxID=117903 RepID=A0A3S5ALU4_9PLAT|nr:unnamed protein product [Protopolystoma xenopodis]
MGDESDYFTKAMRINIPGRISEQKCEMTIWSWRINMKQELGIRNPITAKGRVGELPALANSGIRISHEDAGQTSGSVPIRRPDSRNYRDYRNGFRTRQLTEAQLWKTECKAITKYNR